MKNAAETGSADKRRASARVTYITLTVLMSALYILKTLPILALLKEDYDSFGAYETGYIVFFALPALISAAGACLMDAWIFGRLTPKTYISAAAAEALCALELVPALFYWCAALSAAAGITAVVFLVRDHATYGGRTAKKERIAAAKLLAEEKKLSSRGRGKGGRR